MWGLTVCAYVYMCVCECVLLVLQEGYREEAGSLFPPSPCGQAVLNLSPAHVTKTASLLTKLTMKGFSTNKKLTVRLLIIRSDQIMWLMNTEIWVYLLYDVFTIKLWHFWGHQVWGCSTGLHPIKILCPPPLSILELKFKNTDQYRTVQLSSSINYTWKVLIIDYS